MTAEQENQWRRISGLFLSMMHHLYRQRHEQLLYAYAPLDPDLDRMLATVPTPEQRDLLIAETRTRIEDILQRANYRKLSAEELENSLEVASLWGVRMRVNFELQEWTEVYTRGLVIGERQHRTLKNYYRLKWFEVPLYQRLVVFFRVKPKHPQGFDTQRVYIRMFKNIPRQDIDMMLPGAGVHMTWLDHSKIVLPSMYAASMTMWRILKAFLMLAFLGALKTVGIVLIAALSIAYALKSMFTFRVNTQRRYLLNMTQSLYYQSLGNNNAVLLRLLEEGEQQEACGLILTYFVMTQQADQVMQQHEINQRCREIIQNATGVAFNFCSQRSLETLTQFGIVHFSDDGWIASPVTPAIERLTQVWDEWF